MGYHGYRGYPMFSCFCNRSIFTPVWRAFCSFSSPSEPYFCRQNHVFSRQNDIFGVRITSAVKIVTVCSKNRLFRSLKTVSFCCLNRLFLPSKPSHSVVKNRLLLLSETSPSAAKTFSLGRKNRLLLLSLRLISDIFFRNPLLCDAKYCHILSENHTYIHKCLTCRMGGKRKKGHASYFWHALILSCFVLRSAEDTTPLSQPQRQKEVQAS